MKQTRRGFIVLMAFLMSLVALAIDAMLPALNDMQASLQLTNGNDIQLVISTVFLGLACGLMLYGPLSDAYGRKKPLYLGLIVFMLGSLVSLFSTNLETMLLGRFLQGFGAAACRVVSLAMIRDKFSGAEMAKIMSLIMMIFIIVPALAPSLGQLILYVGNWHAIFGLFVILAVVLFLALRFAQDETLAVENRIPFSIKNITNGIKETIANPISRGYAIASGLIFGAFVGYLSSAQPILQQQYQLGDAFAFYFGGLALCIGISSYLNSRLVGKFGMLTICLLSLVALTLLSLAYLAVLYVNNGTTSLSIFIAYMCVSFLFVGMLFGNLNTLALEPLGHIAGVANSVISSLQTFISVAIGGFVGYLYAGNVYPLVISFALLSSGSLVVIKLSLSKVRS